MKTQSRRNFLRLAGAAMVGASGVASAASNPLAFKELESGYDVASNHMEGKCGEGKCGEGKCGAVTPS